MSVKHEKIGNGLRLNSLTGDIKVETKLNDQVELGVNVDNSENPLKSIFSRIVQRMGNGDVKADLSLDMLDNSISGDVSYVEAENTLTARINSNNEQVVESVRYHRAGPGWSFAPTFHLSDNSIDLEASADYSANTAVQVAVKQNGGSKLLVNHQVDANTAVSFSGAGPDPSGMTVEFSRRLDEKNTLTPKVNLGTKRLTLGWLRKLDAGRTLAVHVDPDNAVDVSVAGAEDGDWRAKVHAPWGNFKEADVSVGRKFRF